MEHKTRTITDNIHGGVDITNETEAKILQTPLFQRLRRIKQLGITNFVFPGAEHTRFAHSIGVLCIVDKICKELMKQEKLNEDERKKLRLSALLHDIGHYPLSHTIEAAIKKQDREGNHESNGEYLVSHSSLKDIVSENFNPKEITDIFLARHHNTLLNQIVKSELDADRMDYLIRDAKNIGVTYGNIDLDYLIRQLRVSDGGELLCVSEKALHTVESYTIGRLHMYSQVYNHKTVVSFDILASEAYTKMLDAGGLPTIKELRKLNGNAVDEELWSNFDDCAFFEKLKAHRKDPTNRTLSELSEMLLNRKHLVLVSEVQEIVQKATKPKETKDFTLLRKLEIDVSYRERLTKEENADGEWLFFKDFSKEYFPASVMTEIKSNADTAQGEYDDQIKIIKRDNTPIPINQLGSSFLSFIQGLSLNRLRVYTNEKNKIAAQKVIERALIG